MLDSKILIASAIQRKDNISNRQYLYIYIYISVFVRTGSDQLLLTTAGINNIVILIYKESHSENYGFT
jgi:hypothetical protein